jgi:glycosyltransferase involved in cell wall biosynthesis
MKILHVFSGGEVGGAETYITDIICALETHVDAMRMGISQRVLTRDFPSRLAQFEAAGVPYKTDRFRKLTKFITKYKIRKFEKEFQPDIIIYWLRRSGMMATESSAIQIGWMGGYHNTKPFFKCDYMLTVTEDLRQTFGAEGFGPNKQYDADHIHVAKTFAPESSNTVYTKESLGIHESMLNKPVIVSLGRLVEAKGFSPLIRAMKNVDASLVIGGEGPDRSIFEALIKAENLENKVTLLGWRDDRMELLNNADIMAFPTRKEGFGTVMIEAWSASVPVVATKAEGPSALIEHEKTGLLVDIDNEVAMAEAINRLMAEASLYYDIRQNAKTEFEKSYSRDAVVTDTIATLQNMLSCGK